MEDKKYSEEFITIVADITENYEFQKLKNIVHHGNGLFSHSVAVGYYSFRVAKALGLDYVAIARAAILHDFYLEAWQETKKDSKGIQRIKDMHGFSHPKTALENTKKHFELSEKQEDMIVKHMFPLTPIPPTNVGSWVVTIVDKVVATQELAVARTQPIRRIKNWFARAEA
ncbi:MAG: uncharacterized protein PWP30_2196 [Eubacteriaceae bacterium]|jgi:uncharacterized protein|nr:uncharacterized protein [Eubacteriaceae bacterium]